MTEWSSRCFSTLSSSLVRLFLNVINVGTYSVAKSQAGVDSGIALSFVNPTTTRNRVYKRSKHSMVVLCLLFHLGRKIELQPLLGFETCSSYFTNLRVSNQRHINASAPTAISPDRTPGEQQVWSHTSGYLSWTPGFKSDEMWSQIHDSSGSNAAPGAISSFNQGPICQRVSYNNDVAIGPYICTILSTTQVTERDVAQGRRGLSRSVSPTALESTRGMTRPTFQSLYTTS